jgi:protein farnesyltransferase subunit beta
MYRFFMSLKQPDGSFTVSTEAEVDVRGTYCLLVTAYLLNLLTPELVRGTAAFIASCQTYEGGFSSASQPHFSPSASGQPELLTSPRPALGEAHGGYTFCALASWVLLRPFVEAEANIEPPRIDERRLLRWLVNMQGGGSELGGFKGRTNKLVDGCYSWWVGGAFGLMEALGVGGGAHLHGHHEQPKTEEGHEGDDQWTDIDGELVIMCGLVET